MSRARGRAIVGAMPRHDVHALIVGGGGTGGALAPDHSLPRATLELHELRRSFGAVTALDGLSFAVAPGTLFGFVGRNGAGKTTTMRIVCGLLAADSGTVTWGGRPIDRGARRRIGYMPEERGLYPRMRARDQLEYFGVLHGWTHRRARTEAAAWLERVGLGDRADATLQELSQGNQQRVQLAAALVHGPGLLVLDEPFAGLDPIVTDLLADILREQAARGVPVLFSSHQLELVERLCDAVAIIDRGRLLACGAVEELRGDEQRGTLAEVFRALVGP
jgi:ABC-2 type transport system ATP-binding protein